MGLQCFPGPTARRPSSIPGPGQMAPPVHLSGNRLHVRGFDARRRCTVTLFDMTGRVVYRKRLAQREAGIALPWSTCGIYLYRITAGDRSFCDRLIVK